MTSVKTTHGDVRQTPWPPLAYVAMQDHDTRSDIVGELDRSGWTVAEQPTGFHLLQEIADVIESYDTWRRPSMIVIDARSRGCSGVTIAAGLRELGITIPIVLVAAPGEALPLSPDETLHIVDHASAKAAVSSIATRAQIRTARAPD